jgi:hypothetical protein
MVYISEYQARRVEDFSEREDGIIFKIWISNQIQNIWMTGEGRPRESSQQTLLIEGAVVGPLIPTRLFSIHTNIQNFISHITSTWAVME